MGLFGRETELEALSALLQPDGPDLLALTGVPGIGKSTLLRAFAATDDGIHVVDCRTVEPTRAAFERAVSGRPRVLCLDHYEHFLLLDAWLRQHVADSGVRVILAGRSAPGVGWSAVALKSRTLKLDVLDEGATRELLAAADVTGERAESILRFTKGHPLALRLACAGGDPEPAASPDVIQQLTRYFLEHVEEREALEAAATVRRVTRPILEELISRPIGSRDYEEFAALPVVEVRTDGLSLHPTVHETVASWLRAADPVRFNTYRRRAWRALERDGRSIGAPDLWRYTADVIYLVDDPIVREAFFSSRSQGYAVEPAADFEAIGEIAEKHDGPEERRRLEAWFEIVPGSFHVVRDAESTVQGFYQLLDPAAVPPDALEADPMTRAWRADVPGSLRDGHRRVLFLRRWLSREWGDAPSPVQGACWLDVKRAYLENRPLLRRVYLAVSELGPYAEAATKLGFVPVCSDAGLPFASAMLDFGRGSVDAWLGRLVRGSLGLGEEVALDFEQHALSVAGVAIPLTPREFAVTRILMEAEGAVVSRDVLLRDAWEGGYAVGSNVVDVLIRALRRKLGPRADLIETVRGVGYRWGS